MVFSFTAAHATAQWETHIAQDSADEVAAYLERHGLNDLLATHLEWQLEQLPSSATDARNVLLARIGAIYAHLLESVTDPQRIADLEARGQVLLNSAPADSADELRLALLQGTYRKAERIAERYRLRQATEDERDQAIELLSEITTPLNNLYERLSAQRDTTERRLSRASGRAATTLTDDADRLNELLRQATFLHGWSLYYRGWLAGGRGDLLGAELRFAELLAPDLPNPRPNEVTADLRHIEGIARSILGMALCKAVTVNSGAAMSWLDLLDHEETFADVRRDLPAWRIVIHAEAGDDRAVLELLREMRDDAGEDDGPLLTWLMLAVGPALDRLASTGVAGANPQTRRLIEYVVAELGARGELAVVLQLAERYGDAVISVGTGDGFAVRYVSAVRAYQQARDAHGDDEPTPDRELVARYEEAIDALERAAADPDAIRFQAARAGTIHLIGWARYFQGRFVDAADAFVESIEHLPASQKPESLWMAIVCIDRVVEENPSSALSSRRNELIETFLDEYPNHARAAHLVLRRAIVSDDVSPNMVTQLLSISPGSDMYGAAQRRAAQILHQLFRDAEGNERIGYGNEFLDVATAQMREQFELAMSGDQSGVQRFGALARWVLEVSLDPDIERLVAARSALDGLDELREAGLIIVDDIDDELDYRRVQLHLAEGEITEAGHIADRAAERDSTSTWSRLSARAMMRNALDERRSGELSDDRARQLDDQIVRFGLRILEELAPDRASLAKPTPASYALAVGDAMLRQWQRSADPEHGRRALDLFERLYEFRPDDRFVLRGVALLTGAYGEASDALAYWRRLQSGSGVGSDAWYEARYHVIALLLELDVSHARQVIDQHVQLNPDYGPSPWGERLRDLHRTIRRTPDPIDRERPANDDAPRGAGATLDVLRGVPQVPIGALRSTWTRCGGAQSDVVRHLHDTPHVPAA